MTSFLKTDVRATIAGIVCATVLDVETSQTAYREAGTFRVSLVLGSDPASAAIRLLLAQLGTITPSELDVTIDVGLASPVDGATSWTTLIVGTVDLVSSDVETGVVDIEGRDLLARLIDLPLTQNFVNQTSSDIVSCIAQIAGLTAAVTSTTTLVGQYYEIDHSHSALGAHARFNTAFDIVSNLAQAEAFDVWMTDSVLNFGVASVSAGSMTIDVSTLRSGIGGLSTFEGLRFDRRIGAAQSARVVVRSWNSRQRAAVEGRYPDVPSDGSSDQTFVAPNMTSDMAFALAKSLHADVAGHRATLSGRMIGDLSLTPFTVIEVVGSDGFDNAYTVQSVIRTINARAGFRQRFIARAQ